MRKAMIIVNPAAGMGRGRKKYEEIKKWFSENAVSLGIDYKIFLTERSGKKTALALAQRAVKENCDLIVVAGGDGTINQVAQAAVESGIPIGFVRSGSGNDFCKANDIPQDTAEALKVAFMGRVKKIDVGKVNRRIFVNVFGVGLDARVAKEAARLKRWPFIFPKSVLYLRALLKELFFSPEYLDLEIRFIDKKGRERKGAGRATLVSIANGPTCGGMFRLAPEAQFDDGLLDICWVEETSSRRVLKFIPKAIKGTHLKVKEVAKDRNGKLLQASFIILRSRNYRNIPYHLDGEVADKNKNTLREAKEYIIFLLPKALSIIVP